MPLYSYTARDSSGKSVHGTQEATSESAAVKILQGQGLLITQIADSTRRKMELARDHRKKRRQRVKSNDLLFFIKQIAALLEAGISLIRAVELISMQVESERLFQSLEKIKEDLRAGSTFKDAMAKHPKVFPPLWQFLIEAGETSGQLPFTLDQMARHLEADLRLKSKIISALIYPALLSCVAVAAVFVFLLFVVPTFSKLYESVHAKLPPLTLMTIAISRLLAYSFPYLVVAVGLGIYAFKRYIKTPTGRRNFDGALLRIPVFGGFIADSILAGIAINLSTLIKSGINLLKSIELTGHASGNAVYEAALNNAALEIRQGKTLASALGASPAFSTLVVHMITVGEESGKLEEMMGWVAKYYEAKVDDFVARLSVLIEPIILIFIGGVVFVIVASMYLPIFSLGSSMK